jgi:hypothetical protein
MLCVYSILNGSRIRRRNTIRRPQAPVPLISRPPHFHSVN